MHFPKPAPSLFQTALLAVAALWAAVPAVHAAEAPPTLKYELVQDDAIESRTRASYLPGGDRPYGVVDDIYWRAKQANLGEHQVVRMAEQMPGNAPLVMARYSPVSAELKVEIYKVERNGAETGVYRAIFGPAMGELWAQAGTYDGRDPFAAFVKPGDPAVFRNIGFDGVQVVVGHAMRYARAPIGVLAVTLPETEEELHIKRPGGLTAPPEMELTVRRYLKPAWYIAAPAALQPDGSSAAICLAASGNCSNQEELIAPALVTFQEWAGGSMSDLENMVGDKPAIFSGTTLSDLNDALVLNDFVDATYAQVGAGVAPVTDILRAKLVDSDSLADIQELLADDAGAGRATAVPGSGSLINEFKTGAYDLTIDADPIEGGQAGIRDYYVGSCADLTVSADECGPNSGALPRTDTYVEFDTVRFYEDTH